MPDLSPVYSLISLIPLECLQMRFMQQALLGLLLLAPMIPELQGRFPLRVELQPLGREEFLRILKEPDNALTKQYEALLATEQIRLSFTDDGLEEIAAFAEDTNTRTENIGARRLYTIMSQIQNLKETLASSYKEGIPLPFIAKRLNVRIDLLYKLFFALQVEGELSPPSADQTIIETPDVFKGILAKYGLTDAGLLKIEKSPDSSGFVVSTFEG